MILLINEAYFEFSKTSYTHLINGYSNLAVLRIFYNSFGLTGSGIGHLMAGKIIQKKIKIKVIKHD